MNSAAPSSILVASSEQLQEEIDRRTFVRRLFALGAAFAAGKQLAAVASALTPFDRPFDGYRLVTMNATVEISGETLRRLQRGHGASAFVAWAESTLPDAVRRIDARIARSAGFVEDSYAIVSPDRELLSVLVRDGAQ